MDDNNISQNQTQIGKLENNVEFLVNAFKTYGWGDGLAKIPAKKNFPCETPCEKNFSLRKPLRKKEKKNPPFFKYKVFNPSTQISSP